jgi:hypothetical protein
MHVFRFVFGLPLLLRLTVLLLIPAGAVAWIAQRFSLGEWILSVLVTSVLVYLDHRSHQPEEVRDVDAMPTDHR